MPTAKKRLNITLSADTDKVLQIVAARDEVPAATKAAELLQYALMAEEDEVWAQLAQKRDRADVDFVAHEKAWS